jgi:hypothetical protein
MGKPHICPLTDPSPPPQKDWKWLWKDLIPLPLGGKGIVSIPSGYTILDTQMRILNIARRKGFRARTWTKDGKLFVEKLVLPFKSSPNKTCFSCPHPVRDHSEKGCSHEDCSCRRSRERKGYME